MNHPSNNPGDCPRQQNDRKKNSQKSRKVGKGLRPYIRKEPSRDSPVAPRRKQVAEYGPGQRNNLKEEPLRRRQQSRKHQYRQNEPVEAVHAITDLLNRRAARAPPELCKPACISHWSC